MPKRKPLPPPSLPVSVGSRIRYHRKARDWTQAQLGERIGTSAQGVSNVEIGTVAAPSLEWIVRVAKALDVSPGELDPRLAGLVRDDRPARELTLVRDGSAERSANRWIPWTPGDEELARRVSVGYGQGIGELVARCAEAGVAITFRGDLPPFE